MQQEIAVFERQTSQPLSMALMIDTSGSTGKDLKYETDSASGFLRALLSEGSPRDAVALFGVNADVTQIRDFTHDYASLEERFRYLVPERRARRSSTRSFWARRRWKSAKAARSS